jgi:hypothetical protein
VDESWIKDEIEVKKQGDFIDFSIVKKTMKYDNQSFTKVVL